MRPQIYINELNIIREKYPHFIENMNHICQEGFNRTHDMIQSMKNPIVCYILVNHQVVGVSFGDIKYANIMKPMKNKIMYIHTISVDNDFQGNGFSTLMVKKLVKTYSKDHAMYMHVRVDDSNPNKISALLLNSSYSGSGLNLENATDIVIYHNMSAEKTLQIIGRAFDEQNILNIAYSLEQEIKFKNKMNDWWL